MDGDEGDVIIYEELDLTYFPDPEPKVEQNKALKYPSHSDQKPDSPVLTSDKHVQTQGNEDFLIMTFL